LRGDKRPRLSSRAPKATSEKAGITFVPQIATESRTEGATIESVKAYRIERIKNGMKFTCTHCAHSVTTLDFDAKVGNLRTQAATAINRHATQAHTDPVLSSTYDSQQRTWR
jgi:hypothetical protein